MVYKRIVRRRLQRFQRSDRIQQRLKKVLWLLEKVRMNPPDALLLIFCSSTRKWNRPDSYRASHPCGAGNYPGARDAPFGV